MHLPKNVIICSLCGALSFFLSTVASAGQPVVCTASSSHQKYVSAPVVNGLIDQGTGSPGPPRQPAVLLQARLVQHADSASGTCAAAAVTHLAKLVSGTCDASGHKPGDSPGGVLVVSYAAPQAPQPGAAPGAGVDGAGDCRERF